MWNREALYKLELDSDRWTFHWSVKLKLMHKQQLRAKLHGSHFLKLLLYGEIVLSPCDPGWLFCSKKKKPKKTKLAGDQMVICSVFQTFKLDW